MLIVNPKQTRPTIEIDGVHYTITRNPAKYTPNILNKLFKPDYNMFTAINDFITEYEKIKNKKSKLSRRQRDYVIKRFEKEFTIQK